MYLNNDFKILNLSSQSSKYYKKIIDKNSKAPPLEAAKTLRRIYIYIFSN